MNPLKTLLFVLPLLPGCGGASTVPEPTTAQLAAAREREPDASMADLERGRSLYRSRCAMCHALQAPGAQPPDKWAPIVEEMRTVHGAKIADAEARDIVRYLESASRVAR